MAGAFKITSVTELKSKLPELNHATEIYAKRHLINKLYLKVKHKSSLLKLRQKYEKIFDRTLGKYTCSDPTTKTKNSVSETAGFFSHLPCPTERI